MPVLRGCMSCNVTSEQADEMLSQNSQQEVHIALPQGIWPLTGLSLSGRIGAPCLKCGVPDRSTEP